MDEPILTMSRVSKSFQTVKVLDNVDFELEAGEVHALVGGNGAGKSTLMKILTGVYGRDGGKIVIDGSEVDIQEPTDASQNGIAMIFQEFSLVPTFTVAQNIFLNREPKTRGGFIDDRAIVRQAQELLDELGQDLDPNSTLVDLGPGYWQITEIAKALSQNAKILIMDEPTAALSAADTQTLFEIIRKLKDNGISLVYISHRMEEILKICDRVSVLRDGSIIATRPSSELTVQELVEYVVGEEVEQGAEWEERDNRTDQTPVLQVKNLSSGGRVNGVSFDLYRGEVLGIAGLMGSGRSETTRAIFGIDPIDAGEILIDGKERSIKKPRDAMRAGLALVPEDRRTQGLVLDHTVKSNINLPILPKLKKGVFIDDSKGTEIAEEYVEELDIKTDSINKTIALLSGGNQQKVVLAKWLAESPDILLLDEPTLGIDIKAKTEIVHLVRSLADQGRAILMISSEFSELLAVCDRVLILGSGKVTKELSRKEITSEEVLEQAVQEV